MQLQQVKRALFGEALMKNLEEHTALVAKQVWILVNHQR